MVRFISDDRVVDQGPGSARLKVIAAGLPRCATTSLQAAFESEHLDLAPSMHMAHVMPHPDILELVIEAMQEQDRERRHQLLHKIFDGYRATSDFPGAVFVDDLMDMYPDAKVVLNLRESGESWAKSMRSSMGFFSTKTFRYITCLIRTDRVLWKLNEVGARVWEKKLGASEMSFYTSEFYDKHNKWVREEAAKRGKDLLEFRAEQGWEPLCKVLGKPLPPAKVLFPRLNDQRTMAIIKTIVVIRGLLAWSLLGATLYGGSILIRRFLKKILLR
jgi:hypothetical protein